MTTPTNTSDYTLRVMDKFPSEHIEAFATGEVGPMYLTLSPSGEISKAEADLYDASFKRILIDDARILRIFGKDGARINMKALNHPWPRFRLDPIVTLEDENGDVPDNAWDVGRLVDITNKPMAARRGVSEKFLFGDGTEEGAVYKSIRLRVEAEEAKASARKARLASYSSDTSKSSGRKAKSTCSLAQRGHGGVKLARNPHPREVVARDRSRRSSRLTRQAATISNCRNLRSKQSGDSSLVGPSRAQRLGEAYQDIIDKLGDADQASYHHFVSKVRIEVASDKDAKARFHRELEELVRRNDVVEKHDVYVRLQRSNGAAMAYHLPYFGEGLRESSPSEKCDELL